MTHLRHQLIPVARDLRREEAQAVQGEARPPSQHLANKLKIYCLQSQLSVNVYSYNEENPGSVGKNLYKGKNVFLYFLHFFSESGLLGQSWNICDEVLHSCIQTE